MLITGEGEQRNGTGASPEKRELITISLQAFALLVIPGNRYGPGGWLRRMGHGEGRGCNQKLLELLILSKCHFHKSQVATQMSMSALLSNRNKKAPATAWRGMMGAATPEVRGGGMSVCGADCEHPQRQGMCWGESACPP